MARYVYGKTWWGKAWINALSHIDYSNRLPRGRKYANEGAVSKVEITDGLVMARVQGRGYVPYRITITLEHFSELELETLARVMGEHTLMTAEVSAGKLPEALPTLLEHEGVPLFPDEWHQIQATCSCPDGADPCKHVAAVYYILANEIDKDPFILFELRGVTRTELLKLMGFGDSGEPVDPFISLHEATSEVQQQVDFSLTELASRKNEADTLFTLLTETPLFYSGGSFKKTLYQAYRGLATYVDQMSIAEGTAIREEAFVRLLWNQDEFAHPLEQITAVLYNTGPTLTVGKTVNRSVPVVEDGKLQLKRMKGQAVSLKYLLWLFLQSPLLLEGTPEVAFLSAAASVALALVQTSLFVPEVVADEGGRFVVRYRPRTEDREVRAVVDLLATMMPATLVFRGRDQAVLVGRQGVEAVLALYFACLVQDVDELPLWDKLSWVFFGTDVYVPQRFEENQTGKAVSAWLAPLSVTAGRFVPVVRVEVPLGRQKKFRVYLDVEDRDNPLSTLLPLGDLFAEERVFGRSADDVLAQVARQTAVAGEYVPELKELLAGKGEPLVMGGEPLVHFLSEGQRILAMLGIHILLPKQLRSVVASKLVLAAKSSQRAVTYLSLGEMMDFSWEVALDDLRLSKDEFLALTTEAEGVVRYRDRYLLLDPAEVNRLLAQLKKPAPTLSAVQVLRAGLTGETEDAIFEMDDHLQRLMADIHTIGDVSEPSGLEAVLRPYQQRGFRWLYRNWERGLGSCLADDMGLGKTVQVIALLLKIKEEGRLTMPALVVCTTTLLGNWEKECARFAPHLRVSVCHGPDRK
ncbi:MAG: SNF2-related protein, partial [Firmicutes bacterium]|nr:SNF2-related protein [Bacillota bacterium]